MADVEFDRLHRLRTAPNFLTLLRICLAPLLVSAILDHHYKLAFALFLVAGLTDALDGAMARLLHQQTLLGQYLDPVADKLLLSTLFLVLTHMGLIPLNITVLVFSRDVSILVVSAILFAATGRREFQPSLLGKANTLTQIATVAVVLLYQLVQAPWITQTRTVTLWATMGITIASGLHYAWGVSRKSTIPPHGHTPA
jgi:cardiolipin synthase